MADLSLDSLGTRFQDALREHNFGRRCHMLAALGRDLSAASLPGDRLEALLDGLQGPAMPGAFVEKARLIVAKKAGCLGYSKKLLDHPSQSVRFSAVRGGLLRPSDARAAFLSDDCGRKLKKLLVKCPELPCDQEVLEQADRLFGKEDKELLWQVLARAQNEELFKRWFGKIRDWVESADKESKLPGLPQLAKRFPETILELVDSEVLVFKWYWVMPLLQMCPEKVLRLTFVNDHTHGSGPLRNKTHYDEALASWGWRHCCECMLDICQELASSADNLENSGSGGSHWGLVRLVTALMEVKSTKSYITTTQKIRTLVAVFSRVPEAKKLPRLALCFVQLLPAGLDEHRMKELKVLVDAFWQLVAELGRSLRREVLVGSEGKPALTALLSAFLKVLPPPLAVEQFFRVLGEFEAGTATYRFTQSDICKSTSGCHDSLMGRVFHRFLEKEGASAKEAVEMFLALLKDAQTMDVVQSSFNLLLQRLGGHAELSLLHSVVLRMRDLELASRGQGAGTPPRPALSVPTAWARFVELSRDAPPHVDHLHRLLHAGTGEGEPLGMMLAQYGPSFFWDALACVLQAASGKTKVVKPSTLQPNMGALNGLDLAGLARPLPRNGQSAPMMDSDVVGSDYFATLSEAKNRTYGRDDDAREAGYKELMCLARKDRSPSTAFEDLLQFLVGRLNKEKEAVRCQALNALLSDGGGLLPVALWVEKLPHLRALYKVCAKTRSPLNETWRAVGKRLVAMALDGWEEGAEASEACVFGLEVGKTSKEELDLPAIFVQVGKARKKDHKPPVCKSAARWVLETTVPLSGGDHTVPQQAFWVTLKRMAEVLPSDSGAERALWEDWPFVAERWKGLLDAGVQQKAVDFVLVGIVELLARNQASLRVDGDMQNWLMPLECPEYDAAVAAVFRQMTLGELPARDAAAVLVRRIRALLEMKGEVRAGGQVTRASKWLEQQGWDLQRHRAFARLPCRPRRSDDTHTREELEVLAKVMRSGGARRQVLWLIVEVGAMLRGPLVHDLLREAITGLDPRFEGMARCIARSYPYLNTSLTKGEEQQGCPDVLTPLLEFWLADDSMRDAAVGELMQRADCHYYLFFGTSFAQHLSKVRQEWLHKCVEQLRPCGGEGEEVEFYHYSRRGPGLVRLAQAGVKRYRLPCKRLRAGDRRRDRRARLVKARKQCETKACTNEPMQLYLWHPETQDQFLAKALTSTKPLTLAVIPRLEFADGVARVNELLASYPREPSRPAPKEDDEGWGWEVLQTAGAYSSLEAEVKRHFAALQQPWVQDSVGDPEVQQLLVGLGRTDDAFAALRVLGRYAGRVKQAKEAVVKMVGTLSPVQARRVIQDVMVTPSAGVALQVAALRLASELDIPRPLELYRAAWNGGAGHRDVAASILTRLATAPPVHWAPAEAREFFGFFELEERGEDHAYVAELLVDELTSNPRWSLPFLPELVERLVMMPGVTNKALSALKATKTHATEVVRVLTRVLAAVRTAARAEGAVHPKAASGSQDAQVLTDLAAASQDFIGCMAAPLEECEAPVLRRFVLELLRASREPAGKNSTVPINSVISAWAKLLRAGDLAAWPGTLEEMQAKLGQPGKLEELGLLVSYAAARARDFTDGDERVAAIAAVRGVCEQLLDGRLALPKNECPEEDDHCKQQRTAKVKVANDIVMKSWADLLSYGCEAEECQRLFARCPIGRHTELATGIVNKAVNNSAREAKFTPVRDVAWQALAWLASPQEVREQHLTTLIRLWAKAVAREECGSALSVRLQILGSPLAPHECALAVEELIENKASTPVLRCALAWLGQVAPDEAVRRWPKLLGGEDGAEAEDVKLLLNICEAEGLAPPELPAVIARTLPDDVLRLFVSSTVPEARVVALQVLQAKNCGPDELELIDGLCDDPCMVVKVAARHLQASLSSGGGQPSASRQNSAGAAGRGKGKRKGKGKSRGKGEAVLYDSATSDSDAGASAWD